MEEAFKWIPDWEGSYMASDLGNVKSIKPHREPLIMKQKTRKGQAPYKYVNLKNPKIERTYHVARLVLMAHVGMPPEGYQASHIDGNPSNNRLTNLLWETAKENCARKFEHGTMGKIDEIIAAKIKILIKYEIFNQIHIAQHLNITPAIVSTVAQNRSWSFVDINHVSEGFKCDVTRRFLSSLAPKLYEGLCIGGGASRV